MSKDRDLFVKLRRGLLEHVSAGWMDAGMFLAYSVLLDQCDWPTGIWHGSAARLAKSLRCSKRNAQRILEKLNCANYINSKCPANAFGDYDVFINNYTPPDSETTVRMRPTKAGLNRDGGATKLTQGGTTKTAHRYDKTVAGGATNMATKYTDIKPTDISTDGAALESRPKKQAHCESAGAPQPVARRGKVDPVKFAALQRSIREKNNNGN